MSENAWKLSEIKVPKPSSETIKGLYDDHIDRIKNAECADDVLEVIFENNIFPQLFGEAAQEAYMESTETYTSMFEDAKKYQAIMSALARALYKEMREML